MALKLAWSPSPITVLLMMISLRPLTKSIRSRAKCRSSGSLSPAWISSNVFYVALVISDCLTIPKHPFVIFSHMSLSSCFVSRLSFQPQPHITSSEWLNFHSIVLCVVVLQCVYFNAESYWNFYSVVSMPSYFNARNSFVYFVELVLLSTRSAIRCCTFKY